VSQIQACVLDHYVHYKFMYVLPRGRGLISRLWVLVSRLLEDKKGGLGHCLEVPSLGLFLGVGFDKKVDIFKILINQNTNFIISL